VPIRVLIADDSELIRQQVRKILESDQQLEICAEAENGREAVRMARQYRPDLVLMDVFMPEMSGLEALYEIKRTAPNLPVVVFTILDSGDLRAESRNAGADAFVLKAKGSVELLPTIHRLLPSLRILPEQRSSQA
jgi:DNA-binding NarL/FixJ family response regulator